MRIVRILSFALFAMVLSCEESPSLLPGEGFLQVFGGQIWYEVLGDGPGIPLLVLHGGPGFSSHPYAPLGALGNDRPVVLFDQLGSGRSTVTNDTTLWRIDRFMEQVDALRRALGLEEIHLLGHSWGSMLGLDYVLEGREGVSSLILASPVVSVRRWAQDTDSLMRTLPDSIVSNILEHESAGTTESPEYQDAMSAYFAEFLIRQTPMPAEMDSAMATFNAELYGYMWGPSEWRATGTLRDFEREDRLGELRIPVLYTVGEYDEALPRTVAHYRSLTPGAELEVIEGAAHMTMNDQPERYVEVLRRFLRGVEGS